MGITVQLMRLVETLGWSIRRADADSIAVACRSPGCGAMMRVKHDGPIPARCNGAVPSMDLRVESYDQFCRALRDRREDLSLSISDVEECAGMAADHLAKAEKDNPSRIPSLPILVDWAAALGYDLVLRPTTMPAITLRTIEQTRGLHPQRQRRTARVRQERADQRATG